MKNEEKSGILHRIRVFFVNAITIVWWHAPIKRVMRKQIKSFVFQNFAFLFRKTRMYRSWKDYLLLEGVITIDSGTDYPEHWPKLVECRNVVSNFIPKDENLGSIDRFAIAIHAFYGDILQEVLDYLNEKGSIPFKLFVTSPHEKSQEIWSVLERNSFQYEFFEFENRGRDILPFLKVSKTAIEQGYPLILKIHTKKSDHRMTGALWRKEIFQALLRLSNREKIVETFRINPGIGILGPAGHVVPMSLYYGINARALGYLTRQLGVDTRVIGNLSFVAGSMFFIRKEALLPLINLNMPDEVFEQEKGQRDGTMAHAYERAFSVSSFIAGLRLVDTKFRPDGAETNVVIDHPFTW